MKDRNRRRKRIIIIAMIITMAILATNAVDGKDKDNVEKKSESKYTEIKYIPYDTAKAEKQAKHVVVLTKEERELIERVVAAEASICSTECMRAVAQTIRDRVLESGKSVTEIITQKYQFAEPYKGKLDEETAYEIHCAVAFTFFKGLDTLEYPTLHFYAYNLIPAPAWTKTLTHRGDIDGVRFYS